MVICKKCLYPDTKPDLEFTDGVCSACIWAEQRESVDWREKRIELLEILSRYRRHNYWDCICPISGGKDSHYIVHCMKEWNMNPLLVCFVPSDQTELGRKNLENIKHSFDVDCIEFFAKPSEYLRLQKYGLKELGDHAYPEHLGIFSYPMLIAKQFNINLIVWAENTENEYGGTKEKDDQ